MSAPHRVLRNSTVTAWEDAGRPTSGNRPGEGEVIASSPSRGNVVRYASATPSEDMTGAIEALPMWAGQSSGLVKKVEPAATIMEQIKNEAAEVIHNLALLAR